MTEHELDVRGLPKPDKHPAIFAAYDSLPVGAAFVLVNNHYPRHLRDEFEVDHPGRQDWKRRLLLDNGIAVPASVAFVPVDFNHGDLFEKLRRAGFDTGLPTVYSWLGVTVYLERSQVMATLKAIRECSAAGSVLVFDYVSRPGRWNLLGRLAMPLLSRRFERLGEPWRSFFDGREMAQALREMGYGRVEDARPQEIAERLFAAGGVALGHRRMGRDFGGVIKAWV